MKSLSKETKSLLKNKHVELPKNLELNQNNGGVYYTTQYDRLRIMQNNRGKDNGIDLRRLKNINDLKDNGEYFKFIELVIINTYGIILEGTHRFKSAMIRKEPVLIYLTLQPELQTEDESVLLDYMAKINEINTRWSGRDNFASAFSTKANMAMEINQYYPEAINKKATGSFLFSPSQIFHILDLFRNVKGNTTLKRYQYTNDVLHSECQNVERIQTTLLIFEIAQIIANNTNIERPFYVVKNLYSLLKKDDKDVNAVLQKAIANSAEWISAIRFDGLDSAKYNYAYIAVADRIAEYYTKSFNQKMVIVSKKHTGVYS